jgi:hypothetical protein
MTLVRSVVNSVAAIASGAIGSAIAWIEKSLANAVPLAIGFLAQLLGLGGISKKIQEFIRKVQGKVDAVIDKAIAKIVAMVKKLFGKGGKKDGDADKPAEQAIILPSSAVPPGVEERAISTPARRRQRAPVFRRSARGRNGEVSGSTPARARG